MGLTLFMFLSVSVLAISGLPSSLDAPVKLSSDLPSDQDVSTNLPTTAPIHKRSVHSLASELASVKAVAANLPATAPLHKRSVREGGNDCDCHCCCGSCRPNRKHHRNNEGVLH